MNVAETLFAYSEWLDGEGLMLSEEDTSDKRSHDELVSDFLHQLDFEKVEKSGVTVRDGFGTKVAEAIQVPEARAVKDQPQA